MRLLIACLLLSLAIAEEAQPRIVGGDRAPESLSRYMAIVRLLYSSGIASSCTATILSSKHLLTAAHCFKPLSKPGPARFDASYAQIGETRPRNAATDTDFPVIRIKAAYLPDDYVAGDNDYRKDIAVIELQKDIPKNYLYPVQLVRAPRAKKSAIAVGYGVTGENKGIPKFIQSVKLKVWDFQDCREREDQEDRKHMSGWRQVCVVSQGFPSKGGQDTCWGDSGGPVFHDDNEGRQFGVTSFGSGGCARKGGRGYYTRVNRIKRAVRKIQRGDTPRNWIKLQ